MAWLVDDLTGAVFGPWGLAAAVGAGVAFAAGKRLAPTVAGAASARDRVRDGVTGGLTDVRDWWSDLYAEAHAEWEQGRATARAAGAVAAKPARTRRAAVTSPADVAAQPARGPKVRGSNGRYVKAHAE
jgi:hypothetical protein